MGILDAMKSRKSSEHKKEPINHTVSFRMPNDHYRILTGMSRTAGMTNSQVIRQLILKFFERNNVKFEKEG